MYVAGGFELSYVEYCWNIVLQRIVGIILLKIVGSCLLKFGEDLNLKFSL